MSFGSPGSLSLSSLEPKHPAAESLSTLMSPALASFSRAELGTALKAFNEHWVESVSDLRLLVHEELLRDIGLPPRLCQWIEDELAQVVPAHAHAQQHTALSSPPPGSLSSSAPFPFPSPSSSSGFPPTPAFPSPPAAASPSSAPLPVATCRYASDMDTNGAMYWLGTSGLTTAYVNPAHNGAVRVTCSGLMKDSLPIDHVVGRAVVRCVTSADPPAWICIELTAAWVAPNAYTLRHYLSWDTECMRSWRLEASRDGRHFTPLSVHVNDAAINGVGATHTWPITDPSAQSSSPAHPLQRYFRFFRITLTGPNSNHHSYLACSGFELYGDVLTQDAYTARASSAFSSFGASPVLLNGFHSPSAPSDDVEMKGALSPSPHATSAFHSPSLPSSGDSFVYQYDLDQSGVLYAIATERHTQPWQNPVDSRRVAVSSSSLLDDSAPLSAVVGQDVVRCVTQPRPHSWIALDLLDKTLLLTAYTLRHYASWDIEALRNWRLEASTGGDDWTLLREHVNDEALNAKGKAATWNIDLSAPGCNRPYRLFRILQTGENSNKHHYLACSGWEMYGQVYAADGRSAYEWKSGPSSVQPSMPAFHPAVPSTLNLVHVSDFDRNGVFHFIATAGGTQAWVNPHTAGLLCVTSSSLADDSVGVEALVGRDVVRCVTQNVPSSWIQVDLIDKWLCPTAYTLRHYSSWDTECLRCWKLEGSNGEGDQWELLDERVNDEQLNGKGSTHTWPVRTNHSYSVFRVTQMAENSNKHHYLACSGWEMYGQLRTGQREMNGHQPMELSAEAAALPMSPAANGPPASAPLMAFSATEVNFPPITEAAFSSPSASSFAASHDLSVSVETPSPSKQLRTVPPPAAPASTLSPTASSAAQSSQSPIPSFSPPLSYAWESAEHGAFLLVSAATPSIVRNAGSNDKWQMVRSVQTFSTGVQRACVKLVSDPATSNTWRFIIGVTPNALDCSGPKQWVGTGGSWGYIAGTGGRCHHAAKSEAYGEKYHEGDVIGVVMDFDARTLSFSRNGVSQGVAYDDLVGPVHVTASLTATDSALELLPFPLSGVDAGDSSAASQQALLTALAPQRGGGDAASAAGGARALQHSASSTSAPSSSFPALSTFPNSSAPVPLSVPPPSAMARSASAASSAWDGLQKSQFLVVEPSAPSVVLNSGSADKWQCVRSVHAFTRAQSSLHEFSLTVLESPRTPNSWIMIAGVVPASFTCAGSKQWVGAGGSWGYIAGTGGKCFIEPKSKPYGEPWGKTGDVLVVRLDLDAGTVEFVKNGVSQGIAFEGVQPPVYAALSLTATGAAVRLTIND